ncbi:MAG: DUF4215 domain-containing protein [Nannocystis sp.]|uniref:DUF4215 domain-containing protein n=1 Tax=Nannocystis sp. TaxID=1962667 RepID=UPI00242418A6|nr:DUF4215 domain-containing protein [Nannocystis sp.]MBK9754035.1 DUF4215 domain-containing protein [Nannocystis sp.]
MQGWKNELVKGVAILGCLAAQACGDDGGVSSTTATESGTGTSGGGTEGSTGDVPTTDATNTTPTSGTGGSGSDSVSAGQTTSGSTGDVTVSSSGTVDMCGNAVVDPPEVCDDGVNDGGYDGCAPDCSALGPFCGDAMMNGAETCDDGNQIDDDGCSNACVAAVCGDGVVQAPEECDDMNADDTDMCVTGCKNASCGDSFILAGVEVCDDGVNDGMYGGCAQDCSALAAFCGDGMKNGPEACDDKNMVSSDGCLGDCTQPPNCLAIKTFDPAAKDGVYTLKVGDITWQAYCDMTFDGGGWTLAAKAIPTDGWAYNSPRWTDNMVFNANMPDFDHTAAKLATWNLVPFTDILLGMESPVGNMNPPKPTYLKLAMAKASLFALFSPGTYVATMGTKAGWAGLVPASSLQANCNQEGINNAPNNNGPRVRLGILGNNQNDCLTPDSALGVGFGNFTCQNNPFISVGNINCEPNPPTKKNGMAWIFVR